jgi:hypothetical protein
MWVGAWKIKVDRLLSSARAPCSREISERGEAKLCSQAILQSLIKNEMNK